MPLSAAIAALLSYLLGCLNAGYYYAKLVHGLDIRRAGSGNAGARNTGRLFGKRAFMLVFLADAAKGVAATAAGLTFGPQVGALCAIAVVLGHIWPFQLGFSGGKGVASALGSLLLLAPWALACVALAYAAFKATSQSSSRAGVAAFRAAAVGFTFVLDPEQVGALWVLAVVITMSRRKQLSPDPVVDRS